MFNDGLNTHILSSADAMVRITELGDIEIVRPDGVATAFTCDQAVELVTVLAAAVGRVRQRMTLVSMKPTRRLKP